MEIRLAKIISGVLHPILLPFYTIVLMLQLNTISIVIIPEQARWLIIGMILIATIVFPFLILLLFMRKGIINSLHLDEKEERLYPYVMMIIIYYILYLLFTTAKIPHLINIFLAGTSALIMLTLVINIRWKISIHTAGIGGVTGAFTGISIHYMLDIHWLIIILILLSGISGYARLKLESHKPAQVYWGWLMGFAGLFFLIILS